jgi:hypothetical protein
MTSTNDTFGKSVVAANVTKTNSLASAEMTRQATIDAAKSVVGYREGFPTGYATYAAAVATANAAKIQAWWDAERIKQSAIEVARDTVRAAGERPT